MRIQPPNYTQTPNVCFDEIFKTLKEGELRVILVLIRQTFGWNKSHDRISLSQIADKTGMERRSVCRSLDSLIEKGLIEKKKFGEKGREKCYFSICLDLSNEIPDNDDGGQITQEELDLISNNSYQCHKDTPPVSNGHPPSVLKTPTKETNTKETIQKKQQQPPLDAKPIKPVAAAFFDCLKDEDIPESEKVYISKHYTESQVQHALSYCKHPMTKISTTFIQTLKWACKNQPSMPKDPEKEKSQAVKAEVQMDNLVFARRERCKEISKIHHNHLKEKGIKFTDKEYVTVDDRVEYVSIGNDKLYYKDMSFNDLIKHFFRKYNIFTGTQLRMA